MAISTPIATRWHSTCCPRAGNLGCDLWSYRGGLVTLGIQSPQRVIGHQAREGIFRQATAELAAARPAHRSIISRKAQTNDSPTAARIAAAECGSRVGGGSRPPSLAAFVSSW